MVHRTETETHLFPSHSAATYSSSSNSFKLLLLLLLLLYSLQCETMDGYKRRVAAGFVTSSLRSHAYAYVYVRTYYVQLDELKG